MSIQVSDRLEGVTMPISGITVDIPRLRKLFDDLVRGLMAASGQDFHQWVQTSTGKQTINLSHHPAVTGLDRYMKMTGGYKDLKDLHDQDVWEHDFNKITPEIQNSYAGQLFDTVGEYHLAKHGTPVKGRHQLVWLAPGHCYDIHYDAHTTYRYHIPIHTHPDVIWTFRQDKDVDLVHMPADGRIWELDPIKAEHTVANYSNSLRLHLIMTSV
jgi:hypothetical protein